MLLYFCLMRLSRQYLSSSCSWEWTFHKYRISIWYWIAMGKQYFVGSDTGIWFNWGWIIYSSLKIKKVTAYIYIYIHIYMVHLFLAAASSSFLPKNWLLHSQHCPCQSTSAQPHRSLALFFTSISFLLFNYMRNRNQGPPTKLKQIKVSKIKGIKIFFLKKLKSRVHRPLTNMVDKNFLIII